MESVRAGLPVVILTSSNEDEDIARSYSLGANAYVRKPVEFAELVDAAKTLGLFWLLLNQPLIPISSRSIRPGRNYARSAETKHNSLDARQL
jgi:CheY-like chemotaxis protein